MTGADPLVGPTPLGASGVTVSGVGLGTAGLARRLGAARIEAVFAAALDEGITHFDTAPMYGLGQAEETLGRFIASRREEVTVTTKFGLLPPPAAAARVLPGRLLRGPIRPGRADFHPDSLRRSLERSLRALRTDYVDVLLVHECSPGQLTDEVVELLFECVAAGKARATGTATGITATASIADARAPFPAIAQLPWSPGTWDTQAESRGVITHSAVRHALVRWKAAGRGPGRLVEWGRELGVHCDRPGVIAGLALALARRDSAARATLFSARDAGRVRETCRDARAYGDDPSLLDRFERVIAPDAPRSFGP